MDKIKIQVLPLAESITGNPVVMGTLRAEDYSEIYNVDQSTQTQRAILAMMEKGTKEVKKKQGFRRMLKV